MAPECGEHRILHRHGHRLFLLLKGIPRLSNWKWKELSIEWRMCIDELMICGDGPPHITYGKQHQYSTPSTQLVMQDESITLIRTMRGLKNELTKVSTSDHLHLQK